MENKVEQIPLAYKTKEDLKKVVKLCQSLGYKIFHKLDDIDSIKNHIVAIVVDTKEKNVFQINVTCMAAWCSLGSKPKKPIYAHELLENYQKLLIERDIKFYAEMIQRASADASRPGGVLLFPGKNKA